MIRLKGRSIGANLASRHKAASTPTATAAGRRGPSTQSDLRWGPAGMASHIGYRRLACAGRITSVPKP